MTLLVPERLDDLVTTSEAAEICGVQFATIRMWVSRGHLSPTGLDERNRPLYKVIDVLRCDRDRRLRAGGKNRGAL